MPTTKNVTLPCTTCGQPTVHTVQTPNHLLHLLLSIFTAGLWLLVWIVLAAKSPKPVCTVCASGKPTIAAAMLVLLAACGADSADDDGSIFGTWEFASDGECGERVDSVTFHEATDFNGNVVADEVGVQWQPDNGWTSYPFDGNEIDFLRNRYVVDDFGDERLEELIVEMTLEPLSATVIYDGVRYDFLDCVNGPDVVVPVKVSDG